MHENINEKISQFLDDELNAEDSYHLMQQVMQDAKLKNTLLRYEAIGHTLKTEAFIAPRANFLDNIHQAIENDPVYLLPQQRKTVTFKPQHKVLALVASAALVAVILPKSITNITGSQMKASSGVTLAQRQAGANREGVIKQMPHSDHTPLNRQINEYMQAHAPAVEKDLSDLTATTAFGQQK